MWNFIKTALSLIGLFVMIVIVVGLYASLVQDTDIDSQNNDSLLDQATSTNQSATSSDFIKIDKDEFIPENTIDF